MIKVINLVRNYTILFCVTWILIHVFYYCLYSDSPDTTAELIVYGFRTYIGYYTAALFTIIVIIALILLHDHSKKIIRQATIQADMLLNEAGSEINEIKLDLARKMEQLEQERCHLESEYERKNMEKSIELEAIRKKLAKMKKNKFDSRRQKQRAM